MRTAFIKTLVQMAAQDPDVYLIVGDLGFSVVESFKNLFPDRFINAGIAEQNMIGVAAGLCMAGKKVFVYSIVPFVTMRCFEQIRVDLCYQNLPVVLVGVGGGLDYGQAGSTHHAIEDIAIMRALPGMTVVAPANKFETEQLLLQTKNLTGPAYFRLSNNQETEFYKEQEINLGKTAEIFYSEQNLIITTGNSLKLGMQICAELKKYNINIGLVSMHTIKPLDTGFLLKKQKTLKSVFTIEEHSVIGGLGDAVSSFISQNFENKILFKSFGIQDFYFHEIGSGNYLREKAGLSVDCIAKKILQKTDFI